jgi:hypothetical protein
MSNEHQSGVLNQIDCCADNKHQGLEGRSSVFGPPEITLMLWKRTAHVISLVVFEAVSLHHRLLSDGYRLAYHCPKEHREPFFQSMEVLFLDTGQAIPCQSERLDAIVWIENLNDIPATVPEDFPAFPVLMGHYVLDLVIADPS